MSDGVRNPINYKLRLNIVCYLLVLPTILLIVTFSYLPVVWAFTRSLFAFEVGGASEWVGLHNYVEFLTEDPVTWPSVRNMLIFTGIMVFVRLTIPLVVAKLIYSLRTEKWRYIYRVVFLIPILVPGVAMQLIWAGMIYPDRGMLNELILAAGNGLTALANLFGSDAVVNLEGLTRGWLSDPKTALLAVAFVGFPWVGGFEVLIYYAGLSGIPKSVNEAALLEGCIGLKKFFMIDIPMVMSQLKLILLLSIIMGLQGFENLIILTRGGPGFRTMVPGLWMYFNAFSFQRMGYACAIGVCIFALIFVLTILNMKYFKSSEEITGTRN